MGMYDDIMDMGGFDDEGMPNFLNHDQEEDDNDYYTKTTYTQSTQQLQSIEINLTPSKYLNSEARYLRAKLINNELKSSDINLEIMHDKYNNNDSLALEIYCSNVMIGYIQKYNSSVKINDFCFIGNQKIKDLTLKWKNNKFYLSKIEKKEIQPTVSNDTRWMTVLFSWADANDISTNKLPRTKEIMHLTSLSLNQNQITELPKEIGNLTNLTSLSLDPDKITERSREIDELIW